MVLGALLVPAVGRVGAIAFGRRVGLLAAAATAFYPELVWYPAHYWGETVFLLLLWWAIERTLVGRRARLGHVAAAAGVLWGLTTLTRELALYLVPIAAVWMLRRVVEAAGGARQRRKIQDLTPAVALVLAAMLTVAPWTIRNAIVFRAFVPVSTMGALNLWQGNTTLTHLQIYEVLATKGGPIEQDRYCREMARETIAARQPAWIFEKLRQQMPEFWKAGSEVLDHLVGRQACGPLPASKLVAIELLLVAALPRRARALPRRPRPGALLRRPRGCCSSCSRRTNAAHVAAYATTRFRLPVLPVVFMVAGCGDGGRRDGTLHPLRGWRVAAARRRSSWPLSRRSRRGWWSSRRGGSSPVVPADDGGDAPEERIDVTFAERLMSGGAARGPREQRAGSTAVPPGTLRAGQNGRSHGHARPAVRACLLGARGMVWRGPTFGLNPEQEDRYRTSCLAADVAQARLVIPLVLVVTVVFAANDYAFLGLSWRSTSSRS